MGALAVHSFSEMEDCLCQTIRMKMKIGDNKDDNEEDDDDDDDDDL